MAFPIPFPTLKYVKQNLMHLLAAILAVILATIIIWVMKNWVAEGVIESVSAMERFFTAHLSSIEIGLTLFLLSSFEIIGRLIKRFRRGALALISGLFFYNLNTDETSIKKTLSFISIETVGCSALNILGSTGWDTFGASNSPLHRALINCNEVRIILAYPMGDPIRQRAVDLNEDPEGFIKKIYDTIHSLEDAKQKGARVQLRMYRSYPLWKFIILPNYLFVQQYPRDRHVNESCCYGYEKTGVVGQISVYDHLLRQFLSLWDAKHIGTYNFNTRMLEFRGSSGEIINQLPVYPDSEPEAETEPRPEPNSESET